MDGRREGHILSLRLCPTRSEACLLRQKPIVLSTPSEIFERLSKDGHRLTSSRRAVVYALHTAGGPVTVRDLHARVGRDADLVTVYRTLSWLVELGIARPVAAAGGADRFELSGEGEHTHHLHCRSCGRVFTVPVCGLDPAVTGRISREHGFSVSGHAITFHGTCADCTPA
jgi:Fur family ferric uptake transcriptional regulator